MAEWRKARAAAWRRQNRLPRRGESPDGAVVLSALWRAWTTTAFATTLLAAALAIAQVWDGAVFRQALQDSLQLDPQCVQPTEGHR